MLHLEPGWNLKKLRLEPEYPFNVYVKIMDSSYVGRLWCVKYHV